MNSPDPGSPGYLETRALLLLLVAVTLALGWILLPFYGAILWGGVIGLIFSPVYRRLLPRLRGRRTPAAFITLLLVLLIVILPFALLSAALGREALLVYERVQSGEWDVALYFRRLFDAMPGFVRSAFDRAGLVDFDTLQRRGAAAVAQGSQLIATRALSIGQGTFEFVFELFITVYIAFFLIRDGSAISSNLRRALPLAPEHKRELFEKFSTVIRATVKGTLVVAAIQGLLGGLAFWALGVGAPLLWGVMMAFLALVPAVGAALVWLPVATYFLVTGAVWQGVVLLAFGVLVIGLVDNLLRPMLVGKDTRMPDYVVMITTLGGIVVFGLNGFVIGPLIAAMFIAVWHLYTVARNPPVA